jgi:hypothetical protein
VFLYQVRFEFSETDFEGSARPEDRLLLPVSA